MAVNIASNEGHGAIPVVALGSAPEVRAALAGALKAFPLRHCARVGDAIPALEATGAATLFVDQENLDGEFSVRVVAHIALFAPRLQIVVVKRNGATGAGATVAPTRVGAADILALDTPHFAERVQNLVQRVDIGTNIAILGERLSAGLPDGSAWIVQQAFERIDCGTVAQLRSATGLTERTLERRLTDIGTNARTILAWRRLAGGVIVNERTLLSIDRVAYESGYDSPASFRRAIRRWCKVSRERLIADGGSDRVVAVLRGQMDIS